MLNNPFAHPGRFFKGNLHAHSTNSDGALPPAVVCNTYAQKGYDFLALTDHFLPTYAFPVSDTRPFRTPEFTTLFGAELHVPQTSLGESWHILAIGLPLEFEPTRVGESAPDIAARAAKAGAFVTLVHPAWYGLGVEDAQAIEAAHAIEVYNHTSAIRTDRGDGWGLLDQLLSNGTRLNALACDDAHFQVDDAFGGWVMVRASSREPAALLASLKAGHYYSTQGPEFHDITLEGDDLVVRCSPVSAVFALGRGSRAIQEMGSDLTEVRLPLDRLRKGGFVRITLRDAQGLKAWSNPLWFEAVATA